MKKTALILILIASLVGLIASLLLAKVGINLFFDPTSTSFCNVSDLVNCDAVALSQYSAHFGIPNFLYAIGFYTLLTVLTGYKLIDKKDFLPNYTVYLFWVALLAVIVSLYLLFVSTFIIKSFCIMCVTLDVVNVFILALAYFANKTSIKSLFDTLIEDIQMYFNSKSRTIIFLLLGLVGFLLLSYFDANPILGKAPEVKKVVEVNASKVDLTYDTVSEDRLIYSKTDKPEITILMFTDYECHFCHLAELEVKKLLEKNPDIRLVFKDYPLDQACNYSVTRPFHQYACKAALYARCAAKQGDFWRYHDLLFAHQGPLDDDTLREYAKQLDLNVENLNQCVQNNEPMDIILTNIDEGNALGVSGTPTLFVNGVKMEGYKSYEELQKLVNYIKEEKEKQKKAAEEQMKKMNEERENANSR